MRRIIQNHRFQHLPGSQQHDNGKQRQLHQAGDPGGQPGTEIGTRHTRDTKQHHDTPVDQLFLQIGQTARQCDGTNDGQRACDSEFFILTDQVDQHRYRQESTHQSPKDRD